MLPSAVEGLTRRNAGLIDLGEIRRLGFDRRRAAEWVTAGWLERVVPGVYRKPGAAPPEQCLHIPLRYLHRDEPVLTATGALAWFGTEGFELPCVPTVLVPRTRQLRLASAPFTIQRTALDLVPRWAFRGLHVAAPARALADAALIPSTGDKALRVAVDHVRQRFGLHATQLVQEWQGIRHRGARRLLAMAAEGVFEQESEGERDAFQTVFRPHPPVPDCQVVLAGGVRVDFAFLFAALVIEYLGAVHNRQVDRDTRRTYGLERHGLRVIAMTKSMLRDADGLAAHIHGIRRHRERLMRQGLLRPPPLPAPGPRLTPLRTVMGSA